MKLIRYIIIFSLFSTLMFSQGYPQNSLYLTDLYSINPACGGLDRSLSVNFNFRDQWTGFSENPKQLNLNAHLPIYLINGGIGLAINSDALGALKKNSIKLSYNYIKKNRIGLLSGGIALGYANTRLNAAELITPEGIYIDGQFSHEDLLLSEESRSSGRIVYEMGAFLGTDRFDLGISFSNFILPNTELSGLKVDNLDALKLFFRMPYYAGETTFHPSLLIKSNFKSVQSELSCLIKNGNVFGGTSIRGYNKNSLDAIILIVGIKMNTNYTISYSYDIGISEVRQVSQGTHEININYNLNKLIGIGLLPEIIYNPRNL